MEDNKIFFFDKASEIVKEEHLFLNNYFPSPIKIDSINYPTVEHYYHV
jgi:predicted NAD-dependent protein-ADP-ribosyltransferase YbiA (DUF1768 family)